MLDRIRVFPIAVLALFVVLAVIIYLVTAKSKPQKPAPEPGPGPVAPAAASTADVPRPAGGKDPVQAPPPAVDPGSKILEGADGAYRNGMYPTAFKFYKDFELRYAGTEVYDRNVQKVWERLHSSYAQSPKEKQEPDTPAYIEARRQLAEEWKKLKPRMTVPPPADAKADVEKYRESLPPTDGRRKVIDAWLEL